MFNGKFALEAMGTIITKGVPVSLLIVFLTVVISMPLAFLVGLMRYKRVKVITPVFTVLISFFRGVPLMVLIFRLMNPLLIHLRLIPENSSRHIPFLTKKNK